MGQDGVNSLQVIIRKMQAHDREEDRVNKVLIGNIGLNSPCEIC